MGRYDPKRNLGAILILLCVFATACGGGTPAPSRVATRAAASTAAKPAPPPPAQSTPLTHVTLLLDWLVGGYHAAYYVGVAKGYYKRYGLSVSISPGKGSASTIEQVGHGNFDFGIGDASVAVGAAAKGVPVKVVADYFQKSPDGLETLASSHIAKPSDLVGKTVAYAPGGVSPSLFKAFEKANHLKPTSIHVVTLAPNNLPAALADKKVAAIGEFDITIVPELALKGFKTGVLLYSDWGVPTLSSGIVVGTALLKAHPKTVTAFVQATDQAWAWTAAHQKQAIAILKSKVSTVSGGASEALKLAVQLLHTKNSQGRPIGWMSPKDWTATLNTLKQYEGMKTLGPPSEYFTDRYIGSGG